MGFMSFLGLESGRDIDKQAFGLSDEQRRLQQQASDFVSQALAKRQSGEGSLAEQQLKAAQERILQQAASLAVSARGVSPALALRGALQFGTQAGLQTQQQGALLRAQEETDLLGMLQQQQMQIAQQEHAGRIALEQALINQAQKKAAGRRQLLGGLIGAGATLGAGLLTGGLGAGLAGGASRAAAGALNSRLRSEGVSTTGLSPSAELQPLQNTTQPPSTQQMGSFDSSVLSGGLA